MVGPSELDKQSNEQPIVYFQFQLLLALRRVFPLIQGRHLDIKTIQRDIYEFNKNKT